MEQIITKLFEMISVGYFASVIILSFLVIKVLDSLNKEKVVPTWLKRVVTLLVGVVLFFLFRKFTEVSFEVLFTSYLFAVFVYDAAIKLLIEKLKLDYRK